jgi:phosphoribosylformylglycinamidine synthase
LDLGVAAIGGKDSMSGSFEDLDVPPTLISFAVATGNVNNVISGEFKKAGSKVFWLSPKTKTQKNAAPAIDEKSFIALLDYIEQHIAKNDIISTWSLERFGAAEALIKMCLGNKLGLKSEKNINADTLFLPSFGSFICEIPIEKNIVCDTDEFIMQYIGATIDEYTLYIYNTQKNDYETIDMDALQNIYEQQFESFMPSHTVREKSSSKDNIQNVMQVMYERGESSSKDSGQTVMQLAHERGEAPRSSFSIIKGARPRALIPVFPGTNCEYDTARALQRAGADPEIFVVNNLSSGQTKESAKELAARINNSNMLILPGGFSGGDEPDGSAKLICAFFRGPDVATSVMDLLEKRDGLMLGICNGFQALVKLGLVPFGKIMEIEEDFPTLTFNTLGRHQSMLVRTKLCSNLSPWFLCEDAGAIHTIPVSHGEGCFVANESFIKALSDRGQIACQYVDLDGVATMDPRYNPNGSAAAIEAVSSADGRVLGKMAHSERVGNQLYKNIPGKTFQKLFEGGVRYFSYFS